MTDFDEYIIAHAEDEEEYIDDEFLGNECPNCRELFENDDEVLSHICAKEIREY